MSIADRPGLAPGMVGGFIRANGGFMEVKRELDLSGDYCRFPGGLCCTCY